MEPELNEYAPSSGRHDKGKKLFITLVNSLVLYLLAYLVVYLFFNIITFIRGTDFGMHARLVYWEIDWVTDWISGYGFNAWNEASVKNVFCIGPFSSLIISIIVALYYIFRSRKNDLTSLFCLWVILHSLNMFFGSVITGIITTINYNYDNQFLKVISDTLFFTKEHLYSSWGMGWVFDYLYYSKKLKLFIFIVCFLITIVIGFFSAKFFLTSSQSTILVKNSKNRKSLITYQVVLPWALGTIFLLLFKFPHDIRFDMYFYFTILLFIIPAYINVRRNPRMLNNIEIDEREKAMSISKINIILLIIAYLAFRIFFTDGIYISKLILRLS